MASSAGFDELIGDARAYVKPAGGGWRQTPGSPVRQAALQFTGSSWEGILCAGSGQHYHVQIGGSQTCRIKRTKAA